MKPLYPEHSIEVAVNYADTDAGGVVYYARYLEYLEAGRMQYLAAIGCDAATAHHDGVMFTVREVHALYKAPARLGDRLVVKNRVTEMSKIHFTFHSEIVQEHSGQILVVADIKCVCVTREGKLMPVPDVVKKPLEEAVRENQ